MAGARASSVDVVIPTRGRPSLRRLLEALAPQRSRLGEVFVVLDDGPASAGWLSFGAPNAPKLNHAARVEAAVAGRATLLAGDGRGPATARNVGWRASRAEWVVFLDDDVVPGASWAEELSADLEALGPAVAASQGRLSVPLPSDRPPTDWERCVAGLAEAPWITADLACRRRALAAVGGFDERFRHAYREDTDLAMRLLRGGWQIVPGARRGEHPVADAGFWVSVSRQRGNADDVLMRALHGRHWRRWGRAPRGRLPRHLLTAAAGLGAAAALARRRPRAAATLAAAWLALTAELAWARIAPGPRDRSELGRMLATSAVLPAAASAWWAWGWLRLPLPGLRRGPAGSGERAPRPALEAVLFDRDGTLIVDFPYNGDPASVEPMPGAERAVARLREAGLPVAVISNQSGVGRGLIDVAAVEAVNRRTGELLGVETLLYCPHGPEQGCECRKPAPGMVLRAAERLGVRPDRCAVIGDVAADVQAAQAAGAAAVIVPTPRTGAEDVRMAPRRAMTLEEAVEKLLAGEAGWER
jgi:histidinol-phosphate phosphatase family protein